jgi:MFS family permease
MGGVSTGIMRIQSRRSDGQGDRAATAESELDEASTESGRLTQLFNGRLSSFNSLAIPNFRVLWLGMLFSMAAMQMNIISRSWLAYHISGSGFALGLVALGRGLPQLVLAPIGGAAADRFDKRKLLIVSQFSLVVLSLVNAVLVQLHVIQIWQLVVLGFVQGIIFPFTMPTRTAYISDIVDDDRFSNALALDSTGRNLNRVVAPSLGGLLIAVSPTLAFYAIAIFYALAGLTLLRLPSAKSVQAKTQSVLTDVGIGFRYLREHSTLMILIGMAFVLVLLGRPFQQLLPVFQIDVLHVGPTALGLMYTAVGVGAVFGSLAAVWAAESPNKRMIQLSAGVAIGVSLALFAFSTSIVLALLFLAVVGFMTDGYFTINRILVMLETDKAFYGRVMSIYMMTWSLMPLSLVPMGIMVDRVGAPITVGVAGLILAVFVTGITVFSPEVRRRDEPLTSPAASD